jgi:hypothetical protein
MVSSRGLVTGVGTGWEASSLTGFVVAHPIRNERIIRKIMR